MMRSSPWMVFVLSLALVSGCHRQENTAELDARDRENPTMKRALDAEQVGDLNTAIRLYEDVLLDTPRLAEAHMQLAVLLQDYRKDYMGAIYHYRQYQHLRPDNEKKVIIGERVRISEQLLVAQMMSRGDLEISREQQKLAAEVQLLNQRLSIEAGEKAALSDQKSLLERQVTDLCMATNRLQRLVDRLQLPGPVETAPPPPREKISTLSRMTPPAPPPSAPAPVAHPAAAEHVPETTIMAISQRIDSANTSGARTSESTPTSTVETLSVPAGVKSYVAQPGDSVYRIAERFYGDPNQWRRIRDANRDRLGPDNLVHVGQTILIP